jgi:hypothetical protein
MAGTEPIFYGLVLIFAFIAAGLFLRVIMLHGEIRRLRRAIAKLEGRRDNNPEDAEEDQMGAGDD